jgi:hypothetical protein
MPTSLDDDLRGPDWPVLAYLGPNRYLIAWIQPGEAGDELRVQRFRMCLPELPSESSP